MIPTADDFMLNYDQDGVYNDSFGGGGVFYYNTQIEEMMIEFAKLHVEAFRKELLSNTGHTFKNYGTVREEQIKKLYPLENIK